MLQFNGKSVLVAGGSSGIGLAAAMAFAKEGARVALAARGGSEGEEAAGLIHKEGGEAIFIAADVSDERDVGRLFEIVGQKFGGLDVAFNNAGGYYTPGPLVQQSTDDWRKTLDSNMTSTFLCMRHEIALMLRSGGGAVINNASTLGVRGLPGAAAYVAAKHGVVGLTQSAALEYAPRGIRINAIVAGSVDTPMFQRGPGARPETTAFMTAKHPIGRIAQPAEIAAVAVFLASDAASFITGAQLAVDGGWTAQ